MLFTEPRVAAAQQRLGFFADFKHQQRADLGYGGQEPLLLNVIKRPPERRPPTTIPNPQTPPTR